MVGVGGREDLPEKMTLNWDCQGKKDPDVQCHRIVGLDNGV